MKKILIPIDFSDYSLNAAQYAIALAKVLPASLHFCHAVLVPATNPMSGLIVWPLEEYDDIIKESDSKLEVFIAQFKNDAKLNITYSTALGTVKEVVDKICDDEKTDLVIMGLAGANKLTQFIIGSNSKAMIDNCKIPVLLVPKNAKFDHLKKIAFATDLRESDVNAVHQLAGLFYPFNSDILLAHVASTEDKDDKQAKHFLSCITNKINYAKIYYRHINQQNTFEGIKWITENTQTSLIAMIHRNRSLIADIFETSHTKKLAQFTKLPLLVMPDRK
ncbi:MAG: universal stress protein [Pedobacter sp.]|nr:MAG: universal stress protein [Pedobacter sp.]